MSPLTSTTILSGEAAPQTTTAIGKEAAAAAASAALTMETTIMTGPSQQTLRLMNDSVLGSLIAMSLLWVLLVVFLAWNFADIESPLSFVRRMRQRTMGGAVMPPAVKTDRSKRQAAFIAEALERQRLLRSDPNSTPEPELKVFMAPCNDEASEVERGMQKMKRRYRGMAEVEMVELVSPVVIPMT